MPAHARPCASAPIIIRYIQKGSPVLSKANLTGKLQPAHVVRINADGTFDIIFDDGTSTTVKSLSTDEIYVVTGGARGVGGADDDMDGGGKGRSGKGRSSKVGFSNGGLAEGGAEWQDGVPQLLSGRAS